MHVRLAFAVAAHLEPAILIVDEVLAVGDAEFQKKCLGKMDDVSRREGRTVLFVSHNMSVIKTLCPLAIWLDRGMVRRQGAAPEVIGEYLATVSPSQDRLVKLDEAQRPHKLEGGPRLLSLEWRCGLPLRHGEPIQGKIRFQLQMAPQDLAIGISFTTLDGSRVLTYETDFQDDFHAGISGNGDCSVEFSIESLPLAPDVYALDVFCRSRDIHSSDYVRAAAQVEVMVGPRSPPCVVQQTSGVHLACTWSSTGDGLDATGRARHREPDAGRD
jgi:homopolymeric O-antigen transport system ATP-binding protein